MKATGKHSDKALTDAKVRKLQQAGRYADGNGLYHIVDTSGAKRWLLRTVVQGKRRDMGPGSVRLVGLKDAGDLAAKYRRVARDGGDPIAARKRSQQTVPTFQEAGVGRLDLKPWSIDCDGY